MNGDPAEHANSDHLREMIDLARRQASELAKCAKALGPAPGSLPGYDHLEPLGRGGMGVVYRAVQLSTSRPVAVKVLLSGQFASEDDLKRFQREIRITSRFQHPGIVRVLDAGLAITGEPFYAMDYVEGQRLEEYLRQVKPDTDTIIRHFVGICDAIGHAHDAGVVHRDMKPANVMIDARDTPRILDFGLAKATETDSSDLTGKLLTEAGSVMGTLRYLAPEQAAGTPDQIDKRTDIYAIGVMLYEALTGVPPIDDRATPSQMLHRILKQEPKPPRSLSKNVDHRLEHAILKAMAKLKRARYQSVWDLKHDLECCLVERSSAAARSSSVLRFSFSTPGRRRLLGVAALIVLLASAGWSGWYYLSLRELTDQDIVAGAPLVIQRPQQAPVALMSDDDFSGFLSVGGHVLPDPGSCIYELPRPLRNFVIDFHLHFARPYANLSLRISPHRDSREALEVSFRFQPDGEGCMTGTHAFGAETGLPFAEKFYYGHPQAGLDYVLRIANCRRRPVAALWPLNRHHVQPIIMRGPAFKRLSAAGCIEIKAESGDNFADVQISSIRVKSYSRPLDNVRQFPPYVLPAEAEPVRVVGIDSTFVPWTDELLAPPHHPYDSGSWTPIGNWSWWSGAKHDLRPAEIRCVPFSTAKRIELRDESLYEGMQLLRFDGACFADFEARCHIRLADPADPENRRRYDPFLTDSHSGAVGLAVRSQDQADPGFAWGGGYLASIQLDPDSGRDGAVMISRFDGLTLGRYDAFRVAAHGGPPLGIAPDAVSRAEAFSRGGFTLVLRVVGRELSVFINDHAEPALTVTDSQPAFFESGRVALYASRLIATFDSLRLYPLSAEIVPSERAAPTGDDGN